MLRNLGLLYVPDPPLPYLFWRQMKNDVVWLLLVSFKGECVRARRDIWTNRQCYRNEGRHGALFSSARTWELEKHLVKKHSSPLKVQVLQNPKHQEKEGLIGTRPNQSTGICFSSPSFWTDPSMDIDCGGHFAIKTWKLSIPKWAFVFVTNRVLTFCCVAQESRMIFGPFSVVASKITRKQCLIVADQNPHATLAI